MKRKTVEKYLIEDGVATTNRGFQYLLHSIMAYKDGMMVRRGVYPKIANQFGVSVNNVERTIRYSLITRNKEEVEDLSPKKYIVKAKMECEIKEEQ